MGTNSLADQPQHVAAEATAQAAATDEADSSKSDKDRSAAEAEIERLIETDPALVPTGPSQFVVSARLLEDEELSALLEGLAPLLDGDDPFVVAEGPKAQAHACSEEDHEPHAPAIGCGRRHPQLSPLAWLFPDHAGAGRPAR